jgi:hypothetical protein
MKTRLYVILFEAFLLWFFRIMSTCDYQDYSIILQIWVHEEKSSSYTQLERYQVFVSQGQDKFTFGEALTGIRLPPTIFYLLAG